MEEVFADFYVSLLGFLLKCKHLIFAAGAEQDLTNPQAITLMLINGKTGSPMSELSNLMFCDASNVTGLIDGLQSKGLAIRADKPGDRRVKIAKLTEKGVTVRRAILLQAGGPKGSALLSKLAEDERETFIRLLGKMTDDMPDMSEQKRGLQQELSAQS